MYRCWTMLLLLMTALAGCARTPTPAPAPVATQPSSVTGPALTGDTVTASGEVAPVQKVQLGFTMAGRVQAVAVAEGDVVQPGQLLVQLETADLERTVAQAELSLRQAQLRLQQLQEPPDEADVETARAAVSDAAAAYKRAQMNLTLIEHAVSVGDEVRAARFARDETYRQYQALVSRLGEEDSRTAAAHDAYLNALGAYNRAVENADLQLTTAKSEVTRAYHDLQQAQRTLDTLLKGPEEEEVESAQLNVEVAQLSLEAARAALEQAVLRAPFAGTVTALTVSPAEAVLPGQAVLALAGLDNLRVETTDLSERDVARVAVGQPATVFVEALGVDVRGRVVRIAPQATKVGGDVVYKAVIELDEQPAGLRWGMSVEAEIATE